MRILKYVFIILFAASASALSADDIKQDFKKIGQDFKELGQHVKEKAVEVGGEAKKVGNRMHKDSQDVKAATRDWGGRLQAAFDELSEGVKDAWAKLNTPQTSDKKKSENNKDDFN